MSEPTKRNVFIHNCEDCEESYIESCIACLSNQNEIKDPHACSCAIITHCIVCHNLKWRIQNIREIIAKLEASNAPISAIDMVKGDLKNMLEATTPDHREGWSLTKSFDA